MINTLNFHSSHFSSFYIILYIHIPEAFTCIFESIYFAFHTHYITHNIFLIEFILLLICKYVISNSSFFFHLAVCCRQLISSHLYICLLVFRLFLRCFYIYICLLNTCERHVTNGSYRVRKFNFHIHIHL